MKRLFIWITILTVLFSSGIVLAGQGGRNAPLPALAQWFTYPDGKPCPMPCLFGIRPGVTTIKEAETLLRKQSIIFVEEVFEDYISAKVEIDKEQNISLLISGDNRGTVSIIQTSQDFDSLRQNPHLRLRDALIVLGIPQEVSLSGYTLAMITTFPGISIRLSPLFLLHMISIEATNSRAKSGQLYLSVVSICLQKIAMKNS